MIDPENLQSGVKVIENTITTSEASVQLAQHQNGLLDDGQHTTGYWAVKIVTFQSPTRQFYRSSVDAKEDERKE